MSYSVAARAKQKLSTKTVTLDVLGGEDDYTADSYGFKNVNNGLKSSYGLGETTGLTDKDGLKKAIYMPGINAAVVFNERCYINMITDDGVMGLSKDLRSNAFVYAFYQIVDDSPAYAVVGGARFTVLPSDTYSGYFQYSADCGVFHDGRLFTAFRNQNDYVRWSGFKFEYNKKGPDYTEGVDGGGKIALSVEGGKVTSIVNFRKDIVIVREYALNVLHALGDSRHFTMDKTSYGFKGKTGVYGGVSCADRVWVCTENDLYSFDGDSIKRVELEKFMYAYAFQEISAFRDSYLYITCQKGGEKYFAEYDIATGKCAVFGKGLGVQWRTNNGNLCISGRKIYKLYDTANDALREWKSEKFDFGNALLKTLKRVKADCDDGIEIYVTAGGQTYCVNGSGEFTLGLTGSEFTFRVKGTGALRKLTAEWEVRR